MKVMIEFDPTTGIVKIMNSSSAEGESLIYPVAIPTAHGAALNAGAFAGLALEKGPSAETSATSPTEPQPATDGANQDAGAFNAGIASEQEPSVAKPQSPPARKSAPPTIVDKLSSLPDVRKSGNGSPE
jgi:hypothetical protein